MTKAIVALYVASCSPTLVWAQAPTAPTDIQPGSITYDEVPYPYPVAYFPLTLYGQDVRMAYMDVPPASQPNGRTVILLHGMNFGGFYFSGPIELLRNAGYRVVVPDQIGFGRSSKPIIPYNFNDMALNTRRLLQSLGIAQAAVGGHSMGGMLAARFATQFPRRNWSSSQTLATCRICRYRKSSIVSC
jgi:pimeloyl-ACP methyl ester carboxylesterase